MVKVADIQGIFEEVATHIDTAKEFVTLLTAVMEKVTENVPAEDVAKLISATGGWLGIALKPIDTAYGKLQDRWLAKQVEFIKKTAGIEKVSEETAVRLIAIRAAQLKNMAESFTRGTNNSNSSK